MSIQVFRPCFNQVAVVVVVVVVVLKKFTFFYLFIYDCVESSFLCEGFL